MQIDLSDKSVLVTGASTGIGLAISHLFAESGARLMMLAETDTIRDAAAEVESRIRDRGREPLSATSATGKPWPNRSGAWNILTFS